MVKIEQTFSFLNSNKNYFPEFFFFKPGVNRDPKNWGKHQMVRIKLKENFN